MRQDQLEKARASRWRQDGNALVTLDDAERWLVETPLCLYLPRRLHLPVPAPSFVEAVAGAADATPGPERLAAAAEMLGRLVASGAVVALSLFGAAAGVGGEQPDFLATPEALPFLYALQPDRNPKRAPSTAGTGRVSPLASEAYKTLERDGAQTTIELRARLGREVTEAAVLRALSELWHTMRVVPVPATAGDLDLGKGAHWELLVARHRRELTVGSTQAQTTALAMLISFYLRSAVAATGEDVELFLSPVSSRARIRDVVHGLTATRQLGEFSLAGSAQLYVEGSLPEIVEEVVITAEDAGLERNEPSFAEAAGIAEDAAPAAMRRAGAPRSARPAFGDRARTGVAARGRSAPAGDRPARREVGIRKPAEGEFRRRSEASRGADGPGSDRPRSDRARTAGPRTDRPRAGAPRSDRPRAGVPRTGAPRSDRPRSERPPRTNRLTSSGQPRRPGGGFRRDAAGPSRPPRPFAPTPDAGAPGETRRPSFSAGPARSATAGRSGPKTSGPGGRPPFRSSARPSGDRAYPKREGAGPSGGPRSFARPDTASRPPRSDSGAGADTDAAPPYKKPYAPRTERGQGDRPFKKPYAARGERPAGDRPYKKPYAPRTDRPAGDRPFKKPYAARSERPGTDRPFKKPFAPRTARPAAGRDAAPRRFAPRPRPEGAEGSGPPRRAYTPRPSGPGGTDGGKGPGARPSFSKGAGRSGGTGRPGGFSNPGLSKPGFSKTGAAGKRFGAPRPGGPRAAASSTGAPRTGAPGAGGPRATGPSAGRPRSAGAPRRAGAGKPGGFSPPRRKPKATGPGDEG